MHAAVTAHEAGSPGLSLGRRLVGSIVAKDADAMRALVHDDVDFRAVTPGRYWESTDARSVVEEIVLGTWFAPDRRITEVVLLETEAIGALERVRYQLGAELTGGSHLVEQQAYLETRGDRISAIRIVCSGYVRRPTGDPERGATAP